MDIVGTIKRNLGSRFDGDHMSFCSVFSGRAGATAGVALSLTGQGLLAGTGSFTAA